MNVNQPQLASPENIFELVQEIMLQNENDSHSQRISERREVFKPVTIQFTDSDLVPIGEEAAAITRDVSVGGLGLISTYAAPGSNVIVKFEDEPETFPVLLEIQHTNRVGPFFLIGGKFCADWS